MLDERPWRHILELTTDIIDASSTLLIWKPFAAPRQQAVINIIGHGPLCEQLCLPRDEKCLAQIFDGQPGVLRQVTTPSPTQGGVTSSYFLHGAALPANDAFEQGALCILNDKPLDLSEADRAAITKLVMLCDTVAKSNVSVEILHDLRNPLSAITGFADLIEARGNLGELHPKMKEYVDLIRACGETALELTDNLLTLDYMRSHYDRETEALNFSYFIDSCIRTANPSVIRRDIRVVNEGDGDCTVLVSYLRSIRRILMNLLNNAILHNPPGTTVWIKMRMQHEELILTVADQRPPGAEIQPGAGAAEGYGMGLKIVRSLLFLMNGTFEFDYTSLKGTRATARIPLLDPDSARPLASSE